MKNGRLIDIPYFTSPPVLFTWTQTVGVEFGQYVFAGVKSEFLGNRPLLPNAIYVLTELSFNLNVAEDDYQSALSNAADVLRFSLFSKKETGPSLRDPVALPSFLSGTPYVITHEGVQRQDVGGSYPGGSPANAPGYEPDGFLGSMLGTVQQTSQLVGVPSLTASVQLTGVEVVDDQWVSAFRQRNTQKETSPAIPGMLLT